MLAGASSGVRDGNGNGLWLKNGSFEGETRCCRALPSRSHREDKSASGFLRRPLEIRTCMQVSAGFFKTQFRSQLPWRNRPRSWLRRRRSTETAQASKHQLCGEPLQNLHLKTNEPPTVIGTGAIQTRDKRRHQCHVSVNCATRSRTRASDWKLRTEDVDTREGGESSQQLLSLSWHLFEPHVTPRRDRCDRWCYILSRSADTHTV